MSTKIGRFEIVSELSKSASGAVYKANDPGAARTIALKTIRLDLPPDLARIVIQLILQEAENTRALNSQNIALLYGAGEIEGQFCAAMEYVEGNSLANMIARQEGFSIWDLLDISRQVCLALDHADSHGVLHRSLEPAKIMMQWDGTVKVLGYGVSTMVSVMPRKGLEVPPLFYYMSPEQVKGDAMDLRSNIFTWGAILYEMVTERKPFVGENIQIVRQRLVEETPEPPATINPRVNLGVSRVIMQALSKSPEERYQHGQELLLDLEKAKETTQAKAAKQASQPPKGLVVPEKLKAPAGAGTKFVVPQTSEPQAPANTFSAKPAGNGGQSSAPAARTTSPSGLAAPKSGFAQKSEAQKILNSAGAEVAGPPKKAAAAASFGGANARPAATSTAKAAAPPARFTPPPEAEESDILDTEVMSAAAAEPPATEKPRFAVDPMMAGGGGNGGKAVSFSDLEELPPLKEAYVAPPDPPPAPTVEVAETPPSPAAFSMYLGSPKKVDKPKIITRENAKKAVGEIKKVPPKLMLYSIAAAAAFILLVVIGIAVYIHRENADEEPVATQEPAAEAPVQQEPAPAAPEPAVADQEPAAPQPEVVVKPRYAPPKKTKASRTPVKPAIIPGELAINSTPEGAQVQIDGRSNSAWVTPYILTGLNPGQHSVSVTKPGYVSETRTVDVVGGSKSFLAIHLAVLGATVTVTSEPGGAAIYIDGRDTSRVTPSQIAVEKGSHTILVRKQGYLDETTTAEMGAGQTFRFSPVLKVLGVTEDIKTGGKFKRLFGGGDSTAGMGTVRIKTQPKGAQITVNRRMVDKPAPVDFKLNPGNYMIDITLSGYKPVHRVVTVEEGSKVELNENLEPQ